MTPVARRIGHRVAHVRTLIGLAFVATALTGGCGSGDVELAGPTLDVRPDTGFSLELFDRTQATLIVPAIDSDEALICVEPDPDMWCARICVSE